MTVLTILNAPGTEIPDQLTDLGRKEDVELRIVEAHELGSALPAPMSSFSGTSSQRRCAANSDTLTA